MLTCAHPDDSSHSFRYPQPLGRVAEKLPDITEALQEKLNIGDISQEEHDSMLAVMARARAGSPYT